jgi:hypothetical protein
MRRYKQSSVRSWKAHHMGRVTVHDMRRDKTEASEVMKNRTGRLVLVNTETSTQYPPMPEDALTE